MKEVKRLPLSIENAFEAIDATTQPDKIYKQSLIISRHLGKKKNQLLDARYTMCMCRYYAGIKDYDKVKEMLDEFRESRFFATQPELNGQYYLHSSKLSYRGNNGKSALDYAEKALAVFRQTDNKKWQAQALMQIYNIVSSFDVSIQYDSLDLLFQILSLCDTAGLYDEVMINLYSITCSGIATQYFMEEKNDEALLFLQGPYEKLVDVKSAHAYHIRAFIGSAYVFKQKYREGLEIFLEIYNNDYRKITPSFNLYISHLLLSCVIKIDELKAYVSHYEDYLADVEQVKIPYETLKALCIQALKEASEKNYGRAKSALSRAHELLASQNMADHFYRVYYDAASTVHQQLEDYKSGWEAYKLYEQYRHKSIGSLTEKKMEVLKNRIEMERQTKENQLLKMELELNARELEMTATFLKKKNALIDDMLTFTNALSKKHKHTNTLFEIKKKLISIKADDTEKDKIKVLLDKGNQDFIKKITASYPGITNTEAKLGALIKTGMATKEIATLLVSSTRTVETHRSNLRKKLGLQHSDNLERVLRGY